MARVGLNTIKVVAAAADLVDEGDFRTLSLATLAARLGVRVPSLYKHIDGIDDLRERLAALGRAELADALELSLVQVSGSDALAAAAATYRRYATEHPGRFGAIAWSKDGDAGEVLAPIFERVAAESGVAADQVPVTAVAIRAVLRGFSDLRAHGSFAPSGPSPDEVYALLLDMLQQALPQAASGRAKRSVPPLPGIRRRGGAVAAG